MDPLISEIHRGLRGVRRTPASSPAERGARLPAGALPRAPRAVLFDVYGTLLDPAARPRSGPFSSSAHAAALVHRHGLGLAPDQISSALALAIGREHATLRARGIPHPEVRIERIWAEIFPGRTQEELRLIAAGWEAAVRPVLPGPGCRALLRFLRASGLRLGIVSNAQFYTPLFFEALLGGRPGDIGFTDSLCFYSFEIAAAKPGPELFARAAGGLADLGIEAGRTIMVGNDPDNDIAPAARRGFMTVRIGGTEGPPV